MAEEIPAENFYYVPLSTPQFYLPVDEQAIEATPAEKLDEVGRTQVITSASMFGNITVQVVESVTDNYKREARLMATTEEQVDFNGLGYGYTVLGNIPT
jgi:hypothetical protein